MLWHPQPFHDYLFKFQSYPFKYFFFLYYIILPFDMESRRLPLSYRYCLLYSCQNYLSFMPSMVLNCSDSYRRSCSLGPPRAVIWTEESHYLLNSRDLSNLQNIIYNPTNQFIIFNSIYPTYSSILLSFLNILRFL